MPASSLLSVPFRSLQVYDVCGNDNVYRLSALSQSRSRLRAPNRLIAGLADPVVCVPTVLSNDYLSNPVVQKGQLRPA
jgi:hypothetical protein